MPQQAPLTQYRPAQIQLMQHQPQQMQQQKYAHPPAPTPIQPTENPVPRHAFTDANTALRAPLIGTQAAMRLIAQHHQQAAAQTQYVTPDATQQQPRHDEQPPQTPPPQY